MRKYIIIATAILAAILVMSLVKAWQNRRARLRGEEPDTQLIGMPAVVGAFAGLAVFFFGAVLLEHGASGPPGKYQPAQIKDSKIVPGGFDESADGG
tara:strand:+ start:505 stop:795 length:291 start_codon:yes stop_codon:yes gene_type:complete